MEKVPERGAERRIAELVEQIGRVQLGPLSDKLALTILETNAARSKSFFQWNLTDLAGAATFVYRDWDILAARWRSSGSDALRSEVWLWDAPGEVYFLMPVPLESVTRDRLAQTFEKLWVWWAPPPEPEPVVSEIPQNWPAGVPFKREVPAIPERILDSRIKEFHLDLAPAKGDGLFGSGLASSAKSAGGSGIWVWLYRKGASAWIVIPIGQQGLSEWYQVAERFPPLKERVSQWTTELLMAEYARPNTEDYRAGSARRDSVLMNELIQRNVSSGDLRALLDRPRARHSRQLSSTVDAIVRNGKSKLYERFLFEEIEREHERATEDFGYLIRSLRNSELDFSDIAVRSIGRGGWLVEMEALFYLEKRGSTKSVFLLLQQKKVSASQEHLKQKALTAISQRLAEDKH